MARLSRLPRQKSRSLEEIAANAEGEAKAIEPFMLVCCSGVRKKCVRTHFSVGLTAPKRALEGMLGTGLEPARHCCRGILSPLRYTEEHKSANTSTVPLTG